MKLVLQLLNAALILAPLTSLAANSGTTGIAIERNLGNGGSLGKETLVLECNSTSRKTCEIKKTASGVTLSGKISYADANRIVGEFFKLEEKRPVQARSPSQPILYWGAVLKGKTLKGAMGIAQDRFDLAVLAAEQEILRGFKP